MKLVSPYSFLATSGLSAEALVYLLEYELIRYEVSPSGKLLLDLSSLTEESALNALIRPRDEKTAEFTSDDSVIRNRIAQCLSDYFPSLIDEVVRYLQVELRTDSGPKSSES